MVALVLSLWSLAGATNLCDPVPTPISSPPPADPNIKLSTTVSGYAILEFLVTENGDVTNVNLIQAHAPPAVPGLAASFALAAISAVKEWKYEPVEASCRVSQKLSFSVTASPGKEHNEDE